MIAKKDGKNQPKLNNKQQEAVNHKTGPLLIIAGAGSGKTRTLTGRIAKLIEIGVPPKKILAITFTNKAAAEMKSRIFDEVKLPEMFIGTFHSFGARILRQEASHFKRTPAFTIFDENDSMSLLKKIIKNLGLNKDKEKLRGLRYEITKVKNMGSGKENDDEVLKEVFDAYEKALQKNNAFDFDDLIEKPVRLFQKDKKVLSKYQKKYHYILVDEFQDVNATQYLLIKLLAQEHLNLSVVGDDAQSIYGWRYADFHNFLNFEKDWPKTKVVFLEENYRSTDNILKAANGVIKNNKLQKQKNLWTQSDAGSKIIIINADSDEAEANWIADKIAELNNQHKNYYEKTEQSRQSQIAILYRTNAQSRAIEQALIYNQIPYRIFGGLKFYERKEIKDIMAGLRLAANPKDEISLDRLQKNFNKTKSNHLIENLPRLAKELTIVQLINFILNNTNYIDYLDRNFKNADDRIENVQELVKFASSVDSLPQFLEQASLVQANDNSKGKSGVNLMTIHMSKGLEFDNVFVGGCVEGILPHQKSYTSNESMEEERRLMYVAMTRARKNLFLSLTLSPSRFLYEIPPELIEFKGRGRLLDEEDDWIDYD